MSKLDAPHEIDFRAAHVVTIAFLTFMAFAVVAIICFAATQGHERDVFIATCKDKKGVFLESEGFRYCMERSLFLMVDQ